MSGFVLQSIEATVDPGFVLESIEAGWSVLTLVTAIDGGNASQTLSTITAPDTETPTVFIDFRAAAISGTNGSGWRQALFAVENAEGKRPIFRLNRANLSTPTATPGTEFKPFWTQDFQTWNRAPSRTLVGGSTGYIEFQFTEPLPAGRVYVATHPMGRQQEADAFATELLTTHAAVAQPAASANASGVYFTSPSETDELGRQIGANPMYAIKLSWGAGRTKKLVKFAGVHVQGESSPWIPFVAAVRWMLEDPSAAAAAFRAEWDVWLYFNITPNGLQGGHRRHNFRSLTDPNRDFAVGGTPTLAEVAATQTAVLSDLGGSCDAFLSWHGYSSETNLYIPSTQTTKTAATTAMINIGTSIFGVSPLDYTSDMEVTDHWWAHSALGATVAFDPEVQQRGDTSVATHEWIGVKWMETLQATDAAGWFDDPVAQDLAAVGISVSTGAASPSVDVALSAIGLAVATGAASPDGAVAADLAATGGAQSAGSAAVAATVTISAAGLAEAAAAAGLSAQILLAGAGAAQAAGDVTLAAQLSAAAAGAAQAAGTATLTGSEAGQLAAGGSAQALGTAALVLEVRLSASAVAQASGSAAIDGEVAGVDALAASGAAQAAGAAGVVAQVVLTGAGFVQAMGAGYLVVQVDLAATGAAVAAGSATAVDADALVLIESPRWVVDAPGRRWVVDAPGRRGW